MTEEIKELIKKINQEGIKAAQDKAQEIEGLAQKKAEEIINKARKDAERLLSEAHDKLVKMEEKEKTLLVQAGRDLLLSLKEEINTMLGRLIGLELRQGLSHQDLVKIISETIKTHAAEAKDIIVGLNPADCDVLEKGFLAKLKEAVKKNITLKPQGEITTGFTISFDSGKSQFDFSDKALAEYIGTYLKPKLKKILDGAVK